MKCEHVRCDHRIKDLITDAIEVYKSINAAKRASADIQRATATGKEKYKGLGCGALRVVPRI